ncbi:ribose-5-phosphate isomerase [Kribbia dieselivorans]|uniref:ribose-5-phosphate isomerase n=1 Tax=Kribbia dieselivorans TaxID=331526 RepID=UPI0008392328|nr:ribose-5-phosphate isomerase [Kribbia dieselivorans]
MRVHIGGDHAAYDLLNDLVQYCTEAGHEVINHGPTQYDALDDYPVFVLRAAQALAADLEAGVDARGIVLGGSGNGEQMAANKVRGIRAALCYNDEMAGLAREHNDAQVISLGGRMNTVAQARSMVTVFLGTAFSGEPRHQRRLDMVSAYETDGTLPPTPVVAD